MFLNSFKKRGPEAIAKRIVKAATKYGFRYWKDSSFRDLIKFPKLPQKEQDRIFNEIVVTNICLALFIIDESLNRKDLILDKQKFLLDVRGGIYDQYLFTLSSAGVEEEYIELWKKLIEMREEEYLKDLPQVKDIALFAPVFGSEGISIKNFWSIIITLATGSLHHLRKQSTSIDDPLWSSLRVNLMSTLKEIVRCF